MPDIDEVVAAVGGDSDPVDTDLGTDVAEEEEAVDAEAPEEDAAEADEDAGDIEDEEGEEELGEVDFDTKKYAGKSRADIIKMHRDAEVALRRRESELQRQRTDTEAADDAELEGEYVPPPQLPQVDIQQEASNLAWQEYQSLVAEGDAPEFDRDDPQVQRIWNRLYRDKEAIVKAQVSADQVRQLVMTTTAPMAAEQRIASIIRSHGIQNVTAREVAASVGADYMFNPQVPDAERIQIIVALAKAKAYDNLAKGAAKPKVPARVPVMAGSAQSAPESTSSAPRPPKAWLQEQVASMSRRFPQLTKAEVREIVTETWRDDNS